MTGEVGVAAVSAEAGSTVVTGAADAGEPADSAAITVAGIAGRVALIAGAVGDTLGDAKAAIAPPLAATPNAPARIHGVDFFQVMSISLVVDAHHHSRRT